MSIEERIKEIDEKIKSEVNRTAYAEMRALLAQVEASELRLFKLGYTELAMKVYTSRLDLADAFRPFERNLGVPYISEGED